MAKGECKGKVKKRKREKEKRRNLERESGKVLLVAFVLAFVDGWMGGCVAVHGAGRHDPQCRPSGVFHTGLSIAPRPPIAFCFRQREGSD
jgi:hypothetical protein